ncbi:Glutamate carboxypeptidase [Operophtera brumata]|uniref:Glutamate carboxypeptidase n=1 Tax=Operophtera brumata TaxID=104452 RepID=A0A0L7L478_OPEBR|nr:Glutamate carboxypeptidase [Operophtera brumata]
MNRSLPLMITGAFRYCINCNTSRLAATTASTANNKYLNRPPHRRYSVTQIAAPSKMTLPEVFNYVDQNAKAYKELLKEAVAIPSVSCDVKYRDDCVRMVHWTREKLKEVGATTELREVGFQTIDGVQVKLPPVLVGVLGNDSHKKTICIYGHLDVQPALKSDGWATEPFELVERDGKLFGRGSTDDKGPVLGWLNAINAFKGVGAELPVNLKFVFECMEESGSEGLDALLLEHLKPEGFFKTVDYVCISDNYWLGTTKPSMSDLIYLLGQLVDKDGHILIPDMYKDGIGATRLAFNGDKEQILMHRWRYPIPNQTPEEVEELTIGYLNKKWAERGSPNKMKEASERNVLLLPMGAGDDMAHSQNEKLNVRNYIDGVSTHTTCCCCRWAPATTWRTRRTRSSTCATTSTE